MVQDRCIVAMARPIEIRIWSIERRHFNDPEQPLTQFSRSRYSLTLNVSQTAKYTAIVTIN